VEYCLGEPDGSASMWTTDADRDLDGDGVLDALAFDIDHDGLLDDLFTDGDGDGVADRALLDLDDDGVPEAPLTDDGTGTWTAGADRGAALRWFGLDGSDHPATAAAVDLDGDGAVGERLVDSDGDGRADRAFGAGVAWVDTDGDGRWDVRLTDGDGDGHADAAAYL
jgi:hypothetical protein